MPKRRKINGKSLLVAAGFAGMSLVGCDEAVVANLVAPDTGTEADSGTQDSGMDAAPVANLLPPPDSGTDAGDTTEDAGTDAGAPVANLLPPPDSGPDAGDTTEDAGTDAGAPVANLLPPPDSGAGS